MNIKDLISDINKKLSSCFNDFQGVYFYGSRARGEYSTDSDFDFIIVFKNGYSIEDEYKLAGVIGEIELKYDIFIDYHPMTIKELERNPVFYNQVVKNGIYYEAA